MTSIRPAVRVVVKIGGSLLGWRELPDRLLDFLDQELDSGSPLAGSCVLIAGGGAAADVIRSVDHAHGLKNEQAHALAIRAMDLTATILASLVPGTVLAGNGAELEVARQRGGIPILSVSGFIAEAGTGETASLPASWDVTSDSIAAWIARRLGVDRLILLKSARTEGYETIEQAAIGGLVDPYFPIAASNLDRVEVACLREPPCTLHRLRGMRA